MTAIGITSALTLATQFRYSDSEPDFIRAAWAGVIITMVDLDTMSEAELKELRGRVDRALGTVHIRRRAEARKAAEAIAQQHGFTLPELVGGKVERTKGAAKYRNPANPAQTWSGRGRHPEWIKDALASGKALSDFAI